MNQISSPSKLSALARIEDEAYLVIGEGRFCSR